jgi:hypothetical protein
MDLTRYIFSRKRLFIFLFFALINSSSFAQGTLIDFSTIPKSGTVLVYAHMDDDLIWMLPFWKITETFMGGAIPATPTFRTLVSQQQTFLNNNGYNIDYESNWITPWSDITDTEHVEYYWGSNPDYDYLVNDHLESRRWNDPNDLSTYEINKMKAKLEQYFALPGNSRFITHNNWGEYGHKHHLGVNRAVRELAVKYRKDVWMLGCDNDQFIDVTVPNGITYTMGSFNTPDLYTGIRTLYMNNGRWTWFSDVVPTGDHKFIKIVEEGNDKSNLLTGESITVSGPPQLETGSYIFDGDDDYLTLKGNNYSSFTISMRIRPDLLRAMDISTMSEYPASSEFDRNLYLDIDGHVNARIFDGGSKVVTSTTAVSADTWSHVAISSNGSNLKLYVNGFLEKTISTGTAITNYSTPEFILGQATETGSYFKGQINDVRLYDHALTDSEIAAISGMVYTISSSAGSGGSINPSGTSGVGIGTDKTYTIVPSTGFGIGDVKVDNVSMGAVSTYTFTYITANHSISASFIPLNSFTINSTAGTGGSISPQGVHTVYEGTLQTYTIAANLGYRIADLKVDNVSVGPLSSYTFYNITAGHTIDAIFTPIPTYTITASAGPGGSISPTGSLKVNEGTNHTFTFTPDAGYRILEILIDGISAGPVSTYTFTNVITDHSISVSFLAIPAYPVDASSGSGGSINPSGRTMVFEGSTQSFTITPNTGYQISDVLVDNISVGDVTTYTFSNVAASHTISASFSIITYTLDGSAGENGSISPAGIRTVNYGTNQTFTFTPNTGYKISNVLIDNVSVGAPSAYTLNNIISDHTITVRFSLITNTITASAGTGGTISPQGDVILNYGANQTFTFTPNTGYSISSVLIDNVYAGTSSTYTFNNVISNHTVSVSYSLITNTIISNAGTGGAISPLGNISVNYGANQIFTITPDYGYFISDVNADNVSVGAVTSYTFNNVTNSHSISATYTQLTYSITCSAGTGGSISPSEPATVNHGSNITLTITPNLGKRISDVKIDNISAGPVSSYTFNNITSNHTISATFVTASYSISASAGNYGSISPSGIITELHGADQTYNITPGIGYSVSDVVIDNVSVGAITSYTFINIISNHTISATFKVSNYLLSASAGSGGSITPSGDLTVNYGANHTYSVTPEEGYKISDVKVDGISAGPISTYSFNSITNNHTIAATFEHITYTISNNAGEGGSISSEAKDAINYGSNATYIITSKTGYYISDVTVDDISVGKVTSFTFNNITSNHRISATFTPITYTLTASTDKGGSISSYGAVNVNYGTNQAYIITPDAGYQIADVIVDGLSVGAIPAYTFTKVVENHSISASFKVITFNISGSVTTGGSISPAGVVPVNYGSDLTYTISADTAYRVIDVEVDGKSVGPVTSYSFNDVITNHTIFVILEPLETYTIYAHAGIGGSISPAGTMSLFEGSDQTFTISPASGYRIYAVIVDSVQVDVTTDYTFTNLGSDHIIYAVFVNNIDIDVYPNPFHEKFEIKIASPDEKLFDISIVDIRGKIIYTRRKISGNTITPVNLRVFPGLYTIGVYCNGKRIAAIKTIKH